MKNKNLKPNAIRIRISILFVLAFTTLIVYAFLKQQSSLLVVSSFLTLSISLSMKDYRDKLETYLLNMDYKIITCYQTKNDCYRIGKTINSEKGIVLSSLNQCDAMLSTFVECEKDLGFSRAETMWNRPGILKMFHSFIGYNKLQEVTIINTMSYGMRCCTCGNGINGSCDDTHLQFAICQDDRNDKEYFEKTVFDAVVQYCAYICKTRKLSYKSIISDKEAYEQGFASEFGSLDAWLTSNSKTMDDFRIAVKNRLKGK